MRLPTLLAFSASVSLAGCDDAADASTASSSTAAGTSATSTTASTSGSGTGGAGGFAEYVPTPADIEFTPVNALPSGDFLVVNDWSAQPNAVWVLSLDGVTEIEIFRAYRVWSMGVSHDAKKIAFASGDPKQKEHFGLEIGDAIQHTFLYDAATQGASLVANGNINDECHTFTPDDAGLYVCRRIDFQPSGQSKTYRIGRVTLADKTFEWITGENEGAAALHPQPTPDGAAILYTSAPVPTGPRSIVRHVLAGGSQDLIRSMASSPTLDTTGARFLFQDTADMSSLHEVGLDGMGDVEVASVRASHAVYSKDGADVYYLVYDDAHACSSIDRVKTDGSEAATPTRVYDCATKGRFITQLAFVSAP